MFFDMNNSSLQSKTITHAYYSFPTKQWRHPVMDGRDAAFIVYVMLWIL